MSVVTLVVLSVFALALPPGLGVAVGWAVYRWWPQRAPQLQQSSTVTESIRLTCPHCGCSMKRAAEYSDAPAYTVVKCPIHGPFHLGSGIDLTLGAPPTVD